MYSPLILSLSVTGGSASAEPPGCSSPSLSLLDGAAMLLLLLAPERLRCGTRRPDERAPPAREHSTQEQERPLRRQRALRHPPPRGAPLRRRPYPQSSQNMCAFWRETCPALFRPFFAERPSGAFAAGTTTAFFLFRHHGQYSSRKA